MTQDPSDKDATFFVSTDTEIKSGKARKTKRMYTVGEELKTNDIRIQLYLETGENGSKLRIIQRMQIRLI